MVSNNYIYNTNYELVKVPQELKSLPIWACFRLGEPHPKTGKRKKPPYNPQTGEQDNTNGSMYALAVAAFERGEYDGIGCRIDSPYFGIDLDNCRNPETGEIAVWAREILEALDIYWEASLSGTGIHGIGRGRLPPKVAGERHQGNIEMYDDKRFFVVTGWHIEGTSLFPGPDVTEELAKAHAKAFLLLPPKEKLPASNPRETTTGSAAENIPDLELIRKAQDSKNGDKFRKLWLGEWQGDYDSQSEADLALCCLLAFWTRKDEYRIDALFRQSGLCREKWKDRADYRENTIAQALKRTTSSFTPIEKKEAPPVSNVVIPSPVDIIRILRSKPLDSLDIPPLNYLVEGLVAEGTLIILVGKPGCCKSTLAKVWCKDIAKTGHHDILYLDRDNAPVIEKETLKRLGPFPANFLHWGNWMKDDNGQPLSPLPPNSTTLKEMTKQLERPVIVFDTLATFLDGDENDARCIGAIFRHFRELTVLGATVIVIHHQGKGQESNYRGSSAMEGACDLMLKVKATPNASDGLVSTIDVGHSKNKLGGKPVTFEMVNGVPVRRGQPAIITCQDRLLGLVKQNPGLSMNKLGKLAMSAGIARDAARDFVVHGVMIGLLSNANGKITMVERTKAATWFGEEEEEE